MRACRSSTPNWLHLGELRRRGQRPSAALWVTDHEHQRYSLVAAGAYALGLPQPAHAVFAAGLEVILLARRSERAAEAALLLASAAPRVFAIYWRGQGREWVLQ